jgi:mRNA interferase RelE/StbE
MESYELEWKRRAAKDLDSIDRTAIPRIISAVERLRTNPFPADCAKIKGASNSFRVRVGDYRVIYDVYAEVLIVQLVKIGHRKQVYR